MGLNNFEVMELGLTDFKTFRQFKIDVNPSSLYDYLLQHIFLLYSMINTCY